MDDGEFNDRMGVVTLSNRNAKELSAIQRELVAWKRASVIVGAAIAGIAMVARYMWALTKNAMGI